MVLSPKLSHGLVVLARNYNQHDSQEILVDPGLRISKDQSRKFKSHILREMHAHMLIHILFCECRGYVAEWNDPHLRKYEAYQLRM
jgi:hypothetical protein